MAVVLDADMKRNLKVLVLGAIALIALAVFSALVSWLVSYYTIGQIVITTNSPYNSITLTSVNGATTYKKTNGKLTLSLHSGQYLATSTGNSAGTSQVVQVKAHQTQTYNLSPVQTTGMAPVIDQQVSSPVASDSQLLYLNENNQLSRITASDTIQILSTTPIESIAWANTAFGVGESGNGALYTISNGVVAPLVFNEPGSRQPIVTVAPDDQIYVARDETIYTAMPGKPFRKLYTMTDYPTMLSATNNEVVASGVPDGGGPGGESLRETEDIVTISNSGQTVTRDLDTNVAIPSPNDQYIAVQDSTGGQILNAKLNTVGIIPQPNLADPVWMNNTTLYYSYNSQVWSYDVLNQKTQVIANTPLEDSVSGLFLSDNHDYLYVLFTTSTGAQYLDRIGLNGQVIPQVVYNLQDILPENLPDAFVSLVNFNGVSVLVQPLSGSSSAASAMPEAIASLQQDGFDISQLNLQLVP